VQKFLYRSGNYLMFADLPLVADQIGQGDEFEKLIKVLARESTMLAKLHVDADDDLDGLENYWSRGRRYQSIHPLLESLAHFPQGEKIDIVHLLPAFARGLLYTYPPSDTPPNQYRDCHWTSMNFFADSPDDRMCDLNYVAHVVLRDWVRVTDEPHLGDLVFFQDAHENIFHSAVYLADHVLFTKNGPAIIRPWILMHEREMAGFYPQATKVDILYYRRRDLL
jgi:hypothetical protein